MIKTSVPPYFHQRRERLAQWAPGSVFVLPAKPEVLRNDDVHFSYRQDSSLYYLTGYDEPEAWVVIHTAAGSNGSYKMTFFSRERNAERELWEGARYGIEGASRVFGAHESFPISELSSKLPECLKGAERVYYRMGQSPEHDQRMLDALEAVRISYGRSGRGLAPLHDPREVIGEMRLIKGPEEIELMRKASQISALAHKTAMIESKPGMNENEIEALIDYVCRKSGCLRMGYGSIVAGGANACCLHYRANNERLKDGDLLLIDAAGEYDYYSSDITRTFPVGKRFTDAQAQVYEIVLDTQKKVIDMTRPGLKYSEMHAFACESLTEGLLSAGIVKGTKKDILSTQGFRRFYPHGTGHWLGMDVHDSGLYQKNGESRVLEPGMVFTVEPGVYFQTYDREVDSKYLGIGVRIEDNIVITKQGHDVLTSDAPKEIKEIEALKK